MTFTKATKRASGIKFLVLWVYRMAIMVYPTAKYLIGTINNPKLLKFAIPWTMSNVSPGRNAACDGVPWITFEAMEWMENLLIRDPNLLAFEYGSGGSTIFLAEHIEKLVAIEHNRNWHENISLILREKRITNCEYLLFETDSFFDNISDYSDPQRFASAV